MKTEENAAITLLSEALNNWGDRCRQVEAAMMDLHKRLDKVKAENARLKSDSGNTLKNVNV